MIKIERTCIIGRFNLVDTSIHSHDDSHYIRQLSKQEVKDLRESINDSLEPKGDSQ